MSSWWPKACTNATTSARRVVEHRHRHAQVGQVADAALGQVDVVVEEHVARPHRLEREVAHHRVHQRASTSGRSACAAAGRGCRPGSRARRGSSASATVRPIAVSTSFSIAARCPRRSRPAPGRRRTGSSEPSRSIMAGSLSVITQVAVARRRAAVKPGCTGTVEPNSSMTAGPVDHVAGAEVGPVVDRRCSTQPSSKQTGRVPVRRGRAAVAGGAARRSVGPADRADAGDPQVHPLDLPGAGRRGSRSRRAARCASWKASATASAQPRRRSARRAPATRTSKACPK